MKKSENFLAINERMLTVLSGFPVWQLAGFDLQMKRFTVYAREFWENITEHAHPFFELVLVLVGGLSYTIRNRRLQIDAANGRLLLTPPQLLHGRRRITENDVVVIIQFALSPRNAAGTADLEKIRELLARQNYQLQMRESAAAILRVFDLCEQTPPLWRERVAGEIQLFMLNLFAKSLAPLFAGNNTLRLPPPDRNWIERIERLVEITLDSRLSLGEYSVKLGLSARQIERIVKRHHGISFSAYLRQRRIAAAKNLLASAFVSIKNVAHSLGYDDVSHFCRLFREATGMTPLEYARRNGRKN